MTLRNIMQIDIPVTALFEHATISDLSRYIEEMIARNLATVRPPIEKVPRDQPLPLSFAQERLWRNERNGATPDNVNVVVLDLKGELSIASLERSFQELIVVMRYFALPFMFRTMFRCNASHRIEQPSSTSST